MLNAATINQPMTKRLSVIRDKIDKNKLLVHEIYLSIQGESSYMGQPCIFVRTTGCHLRCSYCDTEHAFFDGKEMSLDAILQKVASFGVNLVELTGGEPLLQAPTFSLLDRLVEQNFTVMLETSGAVSIAKVNTAVKVILDVKTPSSLESEKTVFRNLEILWRGCEVKFVISNYDDFLFAKETCQKYDLFNRTHVLFSPVTAQLDPKDLVEWILKDRLVARFQMQLHRILYGEIPGK